MTSQHIILLSDDESHRFALGLKWKRIVVSGSPQASESAAYEYAAKDKSTALVFARGSRGEVRAVGHTKLSKSDMGALSLAQAFTLRHDPQNRYICAITIGPDQVWVCAVADGMVLNGYDTVVSHEDALLKLGEFEAKQPSGSFSKYGDVSASCEVLTLEELQDIAIANAASCSFGPVRKSEAARKKLLLIFAVLAVVAAGQYGYDEYKKYKRRMAAAAALANQELSISAQQAWDTALADWVAGSSQATPYALDQVLALIGSAPAKIVGWELKTIDCNRSAKVWSCVGNYDRLEALRSTTQDFLSALPAGWEADWGGMNKVSTRFSNSAEEGRVNVAGLQNAKDVSLPLLTYLQNHSRAFTKADVGAAASVPLIFPKQPDGTDIVIDPSTVKPQVVSMEVSVAGPLRSFYKLKGQPISWRVFRFAVANNSATEPNSSDLSVTDARGDVYAIK